MQSLLGTRTLPLALTGKHTKSTMVSFLDIMKA
jgi:hypothetical protein